MCDSNGADGLARDGLATEGTEHALRAAVAVLGAAARRVLVVGAEVGVNLATLQQRGRRATRAALLLHRDLRVVAKRRCRVRRCVLASIVAVSGVVWEERSGY